MTLGDVFRSRMDGFSSLQTYSNQGDGNRGGKPLLWPNFDLALDARLTTHVSQSVISPYGALGV
jgi:hypothetical protein